MQNIDKDALKASLPRYLEGQRIRIDKPFCCLNPAHADRHPSMRYDPRREAVHCFSCGADYDVFDLVGFDYGLTEFSDQLSKAAELYGNGPARIQRLHSRKEQQKEDGDTAAYLAACHARARETDYFARRGIEQGVINAFHLGYDPSFQRGTGGAVWQAVLLPTGKGSFTARNTDPAADDRHRVRKQGESAFLGFDQSFQQAGPVFVVEGEFDALSLWEVGAAAVSLGSVANLHRFQQRLKEKFPDAASAPALLLCLDNDTAGERAGQELLHSLTESGFPAFLAQIAAGHKDPGEALIVDRAAFQAAIRKALHIPEKEKEEAKKAYLSHSSAAHLASFLGGIAASVDTSALSTGFPALDAQLDGGLYEGLYIFGAISSLGKTTLLLQMADQLARQGQDVLIFSLEMARSELMAKSISRHTLDLCLRERIGTANAKTARGITSGKRYPDYSPLENDIITRAIGEYGAYAGHLFIQEGMGDVGVAQIRQTVAQHIGMTGNTPVVLVDYLQILAPHSERATDKQNTDRAVLELKRLSRDYKLPVLAISSFNRAGYGFAVTMESFKESGAIEYSSDVLIGLQLSGAGTADFDVNAAKRENPRKVELILLKNRNGATGGRIAYRYYPFFNAFVEEKASPLSSPSAQSR